MTKEALEKEAKEYADWFWGASPSMMKALANAYIKGAEPREKRIAELEAENEQIKNSDTLCKLIGEQKRKIAEFEEQIEKMKVCQNCDNWKHSKCEKKLKGDCFKHSKWVMRSSNGLRWGTILYLGPFSLT